MGASGCRLAWISEVCKRGRRPDSVFQSHPGGNALGCGRSTGLQESKGFPALWKQSPKPPWRADVSSRMALPAKPRCWVLWCSVCQAGTSQMIDRRQPPAAKFTSSRTHPRDRVKVSPAFLFACASGEAEQTCGLGVAEEPSGYSAAPDPIAPATPRGQTPGAQGRGSGRSGSFGAETGVGVQVPSSPPGAGSALFRAR